MVLINLLKVLILWHFLIRTSKADIECSSCPGMYCGRTMISNETDCDIECGGCNRGYRTDSYFCRKCSKNLELYDWLFLGFMGLFVTLKNFFAIDSFHAKHPKVWFLHLSALLESTISFICMILLFEPTGTFQLHTCGVNSIEDWYPVFFNPQVNHYSSLHCTQEVVFPLYTSIFIYLLFSFITMVLLRGILLRLIFRNFGRSSVYAGLYILPAVGVIHACLAGVIYYIYPYLVILLSAVGVAVFLSTLESDYFKMIRKPRNIGIIICYAIAHGYGIISMTEVELIARDGPVLLLIFLPFCFYTITRPFTNADNFKP